jgi:cellulose synthase/poly-beta-1,6-N-acetylglucosamine synthase-like glycosyltransferase
MKRICIIIGFISSILAVILSVTPLFKVAVFPIIIALLSGLGIYFLSKKSKTKTKSIQYILLLAIIALALTIYKSVFNEAKVGDTEQLEQREEESKDDSIELLEGIEIDD